MANLAVDIAASIAESLCPGIPHRLFPAGDLDPESLAFDLLFGRGANDPMPRKISAAAWFDRPEAARFEVREQTIRTGDDDTLTLLLIFDEDMLEEHGGAHVIANAPRWFAMVEKAWRDLISELVVSVRI